MRDFGIVRLITHHATSPLPTLRQAQGRFGKGGGDRSHTHLLPILSVRTELLLALSFESQTPCNDPIYDTLW